MSVTATKPIKRAIFDNDGVNIDSEHVSMGDMDEYGLRLVSEYADLESVGLKARQIYVDYKGRSSNDIVKDLIERFSLPEDAIRSDYEVPEGADLYEFHSNLHTLSVIDKFTNGQLFTLPHFKETNTQIREALGGENVALCTTSRADRMHASEYALDPATGENAGWAEAFPDENNLRVSGYGHDNKYIYFRELHPDWDPEETVIIEDTEGSIKKAIAAGFENTIGIVASKFQCLDDDGNFDREKKMEEIRKLKAAGARIIVTDYRDIKTAIEWMSQGMDMESRIPLDFHGDVYHNQGGHAQIDPRLAGLGTPGLPN